VLGESVLHVGRLVEDCGEGVECPPVFRLYSVSILYVEVCGWDDIFTVLRNDLTKVVHPNTP